MEGKMLFDLEPGDRFYFTGDKKRSVFEILRKAQKSPIKGIISFVETTDRIERHRNAPVIFLRNINGESVKVAPDVKKKYGTAPQLTQFPDKAPEVKEQPEEIAETEDPPFTDVRSLEEAREFVKEGRVAGVTCPCCEHLAKIYKRTLHYTIAKMLINLYRIHRREIESLYHHYKDVLDKGNGEQAGDFAKAEYWGLIEEMPKDPDNTTVRTSGFWRLTEKGTRFVETRAEIQKYILLYDSKLLGYEGEMTTIRTCLGKYFNYEELMHEYINADAI